MVKFFRFLLGYVCFSFSGGFIDGFINSCYEKRINVQNLKVKDGVLYGECLANQYIKLHSLTLQSGGKLKVIKKRGIIFTLLKIKGRTGLLVGAVLFVTVISFLSGFIWNVEVVGNERISEGEILLFLEENGLKRSAPWKSIDKDKTENLMMASFDDIAWAHINQIGTTARIEINETVNKPEVTPKSIANLKAKKDGIIVKASVTNGWAQVKAGDSVTKGDLLISGIYESEKKKGNQFAHASGEYIAEVKEPFSLTVARKQSFKDFKEERVFRKLSFFGLKIPLYFVPYDKENSELAIKTNYLKLNKNELPIGIITVTERRYNIKSRLLSDVELQKLCESEINKKLEEDFSDCEIIRKKINTSLNAEEALAKGEIICLEDIGEEVVIKIK